MSGQPVEWAVGITTAQRKQPTLAQCVNSVIKAGWQPIVFAEPETCKQSLLAARSLGAEIQHRETTFGAWHNWREMCFDLLEQFPQANTFLTLQDDCIVTQGAKNLVESHLWPTEKTALLSLYSAAKYAKRHVAFDKNGRKISHHIYEHMARRAARKKRGYRGTELRPIGIGKVPLRDYWGLCAAVFSRESLELIINHPIAKRWKGARKPKPKNPAAVKNVDTAVGRIIRNLGLEIQTYRPSLAQHVALYSSLGHDGPTGNRRAIDYPGDDADLSDIFAGVKINRCYPLGRLPRTGHSDYDNLRDKWCKNRKPEMSITVECWQAIEAALQPFQSNGQSAKTIEFGSGLSTLLFRNIVSDHTAIESNKRQAEATGAILCPLDNGWYSWKPDGKKYDLILIDGPYGAGNRFDVLKHLPKMCHERTVIVVDDTHRPEELQLFETLLDSGKFEFKDYGRFRVLRSLESKIVLPAYQ